MNFEKLKAFFMPIAFSVIGSAQIPSVSDTLPPWVVAIVAIVAGILHGGDTLTNKEDWRK